MFRSALQLAARRSLSHWRLLSAVVIGIVLAVAIMSGSVIFFDSLRDLALSHALRREDPEQLDILIRAGDSPVTRAGHEDIRLVVDYRTAGPLEPFLDDFTFGVRSWTFFIGGEVGEIGALCDCENVSISSSPRTAGGRPGEEAKAEECDCRRTLFALLPDLSEQVTMVDGRLPEPGAPSGPERELEVEAIISRETANLFGLWTDDRIIALPFWEDVNDEVTARIVGVYERTQPAANEWRLLDKALHTRSATLLFAPMLVHERTLIESLGTHFPRMGAEYAWLLDINQDTINASDTETIQAALMRADAELVSLVDGYFQTTALGDVLDRFEINLFFNRIPMFIVLLLIVVVVLYYVVTLTSLLVDAQRGEIALMRSRGATSLQILAVYVAEAIGLSLLAVAIGPLLALGVVAALGVAPGLSALNDGAFVPVRLSADAYYLALAGGGLSILALLIPAIRASRLGLVRQRQMSARPARASFFQRHYLDVAALGLVVFLFWQLSKQGSFVAVDLFGQQAVDQLVLAVPAMFLVAAGLVLLRVFPISMDLLGRALSGRVLSRLIPPAFVLGLWHMARNPAHHARLSLLLTLTAGLGMFAASFGGTLERSFSERVLYESGAELRATRVSIRVGGGSQTAAGRISELDGVVRAASVHRDTGLVISSRFGELMEVLSVRPDSFKDVSWWRSDFTGSDIDTAMDWIRVRPPPGIPLPADAQWLTVRVKPQSRRADVSLLARLSDSNGRYFTLFVGTLEPSSAAGSPFTCHVEGGDRSEWCTLGASLTPQHIGATRPLVPEPPLVLHTIGVTQLGRGGSLRAGLLDIDQIATVSRSGGRVDVLEEFDSLSNWWVLADSLDRLGDSLNQAIGPDGSPIHGVVRFRWTPGDNREMRGFSVGEGQLPIPALVSRTFLDDFGVKLGDQVPIIVESTTIDTVLTAAASHFPTLDPVDRPFIVLDLDAVLHRMNVGRVFGDAQPNEVWVESSAEVGAGGEAASTGVQAEDLEGVMDRLSARPILVVDRAALLTDAKVDPLVQAGWNSLLGISFSTVLLVSAIGFMVHARVSFEGRRSEFALLRAIGLSMRQVVLLVVLEQAVVIGVAVGVGVFLGTRLGATIMPYLASSGEGVRVAPPMITQIDWGGFGLTIGLMAGVFAIVVAAIVASVYRMSIDRVMRLGEE